MIGPAPNTQIVEQLLGPGMGFRPFHIVDGEGQPDILVGGQEWDEIRFLKDKPDPASAQGREVSEFNTILDNCFPQKLDEPLLWRIQQSQGRQEGGLSRAAGSQQGHHLAAVGDY